MDTKSLTVLVGAAAVLGVAAFFLQRGSRPASAQLNGKAVLPGFRVADVARVEVGDGKLVVAASADGWKVETLHGYPADREKIAENLLKLADLRVGQVVRGRALGEETKVTLNDASGKELAALSLGDKHVKKGAGQAAAFGGYPDGRYLAFGGGTVLVKDTLDAFDGDAKAWCSTRIASVPSDQVTSVSFRHGAESVDLERGTNDVWTLKGLADKEELDASKTYSLDSAMSYLDFTSVADPKLTEAELGFSTGFVYVATLKDGTNVVTHAVTVGNAVPGGSDRYLKADGGKWVYTVSSYAAGAFMKTRSDLVKAKEEPKEKEPAKAE